MEYEKRNPKLGHLSMVGLMEALLFSSCEMKESSGRGMLLSTLSLISASDSMAC